MSRRKFLRQIGFTGATIVVAPTVLAESTQISGKEYFYANYEAFGITRANHLGDIFIAKPDKLKDIVKAMMSKGEVTLDIFLCGFPTKEGSEEFVWEII